MYFRFSLGLAAACFCYETESVTQSFVTVGNFYHQQRFHMRDIYMDMVVSIQKIFFTFQRNCLS